jgi:hypothetical protein
MTHKYCMNPIFSNIRDFTFAMDLNLPYSDEEILEWSHDQNWFLWSGPGDRYRVASPKGKLMVELFESLKDPKNFKEPILDTIFNEKNYFRLWILNKDALLNNTSVSIGLYKDPPGFYLGNHLDPRDIIVSGMHYLTKSDKQYTAFYTSKQFDHEIKLLPSQYRGWMSANNEQGWHDGRNEDTFDRVAIYFDICLKLN